MLKSTITFKERAIHARNPVAKKLFRLMEEKQSNLALAADVTKTNDLFRLIKSVSKHICVLKTHIDVLEDFSPQVSKELSLMAKEEGFLLFEDRKFADIGSTVKLQYEKGIYKIADWADIVNAHILPGEGIIESLRLVGKEKERALLLVAELSSKGNLATGYYTEKAIEFAKTYFDFVIGFICQRQLTEDPGLIHFTPGVQLKEGGDALGQTYRTPETAIANGSDLIIVGRDIYENTQPQAIAQVYRERAWNAYVERSNS